MTETLEVYLTGVRKELFDLAQSNIHRGPDEFSKTILDWVRDKGIWHTGYDSHHCGLAVDLQCVCGVRLNSLRPEAFQEHLEQE